MTSAPRTGRVWQVQPAVRYSRLLVLSAVCRNPLTGGIRPMHAAHGTVSLPRRTAKGQTGDMACLRRRRYDRYGYPYRPRPVGGSCLRDACLLDAGCCLGESLSGNCLVVALLALPQLAETLIVEAWTLRGHPGAAGSQLTTLLIAGVRTYQRQISPRRPPCCHFTPTCSEYAAQALQTHGARRGSWLTIRRLGRCRPSRPSADDPVPPRRLSR